jgi:hypothetical protein
MDETVCTKDTASDGGGDGDKGKQALVNFTDYCTMSDGQQYRAAYGYLKEIENGERYSLTTRKKTVIEIRPRHIACIEFGVVEPKPENAQVIY